MVFSLVEMRDLRCVVPFGSIVVGVVGVVVLVFVIGVLSCMLFGNCCMVALGCSVHSCGSVCVSCFIGLFDSYSWFCWFAAVFVSVCSKKVFWSV